MDPFLTRDAVDRGFTRAVTRTAAYAHPVEGVTMLESQLDDLFARCRAVALILPDDAVFTHLTSAQLRGWWLPPVASAPLIACTDGEAPHLDRRGVYVRRCAIPVAHRESLGDVAVASAAWTIVELAEHFSLIDLVVVIDGAMHAGDVTVQQIRDTMIKGRRGVRVLRRALDLCDGRSESRWETILRLLHVLCGVDVVPQHRVENRVGVVIARGDLWIRGTRRIPEYDGADHRDREQHQRDLRREKSINRAGYERYGYIATEIMTDPARVIRDADDALGRPHDPSRLALWRREVMQSSLYHQGRKALDLRLQRFVRTDTPRSRRR